MTITAATEDDSVLTAMTLNNFLVSMRDSVRQARVHLIHHHTRRIKTLSKFTGKNKAPNAGKDKPPNAEKDETSNAEKDETSDAEKNEAADAEKDEAPKADKRPANKNKKKAMQLGQEITVLKNFSDEELGKLVLLTKKSFNDASREGSPAGVRAICRMAEHAALVKFRNNFAEQYGDTTKSLPFCIKVLGTKQSYKKIRKEAQKGKKETYKQRQRFCAKLLRQIGGADFATAEDLHTKLKKQEKTYQRKKKEKTYKNDADNNDVDDPALQQEVSVSVPTKKSPQSSEQDELRDKIFKRLDTVVKITNDDGLDSSEEDEYDDNSSNDSDVDSDGSIDVKKQKLNSKLHATKPDKITKLTEREDIISTKSSKKNLSVGVDSNSQTSIAKTKPKKKLAKTAILPSSSSDNSKMDKNTVSSNSFKAYEVKQIDLTKIGLSSTVVPLESKKHILECDEDQSNIKPAKKIKRPQNLLKTKKVNPKTSFFHGKEESSDDEEAEPEKNNPKEENEGQIKSSGWTETKKTGGASATGGRDSNSWARGKRDDNKVEDSNTYSSNSYNRPQMQRNNTANRAPHARNNYSQQSEEDGGWHPSWQAKKQQASINCLAVYQGKKTTFQ